MRDLPTALDELRRACAAPPVLAEGRDARHAAVAAILSPGPDGTELWFIQRAEHPRDPWSGQVAFPGGRVEPDDAGPLDTAIRETREEIGVDLTLGEAVGALDDLAPVRDGPKIVVHPYVFWLPEPQEVRPNPLEVAGVFRARLADLADGVGRGRFDFDWKGGRWKMPCVDLPGPQGIPVRLWGMTLRIVDGLLDRLDGRGIGLERPSDSGVHDPSAIGFPP